MVNSTINLEGLESNELEYISRNSNGRNEYDYKNLIIAEGWPNIYSKAATPKPKAQCKHSQSTTPHVAQNN
jgi:hypothetical protein